MSRMRLYRIAANDTSLAYAKQSHLWVITVCCGEKVEQEMHSCYCFAQAAQCKLGHNMPLYFGHQNLPTCDRPD